MSTRRPKPSRGSEQDGPRGRMLAAMLELVGEQGYADTAVADVIARAGASRKTFYEHFEDRLACLLTVGEQVAGEWLERVRRAVERAEEETAATEAFVGELFGLAADSPAGLRTIMAELTSAGRVGVDRRERILGELGGVLGWALAGGTGERPEAPPRDGLVERALAGAIVRIAYVRALRSGRLRRPRRGELLALAPDVARWARSYRTIGEPPPPAGVSLDGGPPVGGRAPGTLSLDSRAGDRRGLPRGESGVSRSFVIHSQRERLLDALTNLSAAKGYGAVTIPEIVSEAAVSVQAFYEHFSGREDAFLVAYEVGHRKALAIVQRAYEARPDWPAAVRAGLAALLDFLASEPSFAHLALIDSLTAGPKAGMLAREGARAYAGLLEPGLQASPDGEPRPEIAIEATAHALQELCCAYVVRERTRELPALIDLASRIALTPFDAAG